jgi:SAM-dependent methyltransferase
MMFGTRDEFDYSECAACGTVQLVEIPELAPYYPKNYYSFEAAADPVETGLPDKPLHRWAARLSAAYFIGAGKNPLGKYFARSSGWIRDCFPAWLKEPALRLRFDSRILDFGCGSGQLLQVLHYFGFRDLTGADAFIESDIFYPNGVRIYKRRLAEFAPSATFDLVTLHHSLEHLPEPLDALREINLRLASGRFCLARIPIVNFAWEKYGVNWAQLDPPRHLYLFTEKSFRRLAESAGFVVEKVVYDSTAFQFWGSELYRRDIPLFDERGVEQKEKFFSAEQISDWERRAKLLNDEGRGDQACFYLRKSASA